jgi:hypothetical protein
LGRKKLCHNPNPPSPPPLSRQQKRHIAFATL